jgi:hypothetical protein
VDTPEYTRLQLLAGVAFLTLFIILLGLAGASDIAAR